MNRYSSHAILGVFLLAAALSACGQDEATTAKANTIVGKVTLENGAALPSNIKDVVIDISGISDAGENVSYTPVVKPDGTYKQKVVHGAYSFSTPLYCYALVSYNGAEFKLPLEHVGQNWSKRQDSEDGIVQDFVLKFTGVKPNAAASGSPNIGDATHWYGMSIGMSATNYREDLGKAAYRIPPGSKIIFTLKATGPAINGVTIAQPITVERTYESSSSIMDINDLMPAPYEITGIARLPDGSTKTVLFYSAREKYGAPYKSSLSIQPEKETYLGGGVVKSLNSFALED